MFSFILGTVPAWITTSFPIIQRVCLIIMALLAVLLIILVFLQITDGNNQGNVITGNQDSYYSQNKSGSREGRITRLVYITIALMVVLSIAYFILLKIPKMF